MARIVQQAGRRCFCWCLMRDGSLAFVALVWWRRGGSGFPQLNDQAAVGCEADSA
jgi:hypothetical protein